MGSRMAIGGGSGSGSGGVSRLRLVFSNPAASSSASPEREGGSHGLRWEPAEELRWHLPAPGVECGRSGGGGGSCSGEGSESPSLFPRLGTLESWSLSSSCLQHGGGGCTSRDLGRFKTSLPQLPPHQPWPRLQRPQEEAAFLRIICLLPILLPPLPDLWLLRRSRPSRCNHPAAAAAAIAQLQSRAKQQQSEGHQLPPSAEPFPSCRRRPTTSSFCHLSPPFSSATDSQT